MNTNNRTQRGKMVNGKSDVRAKKIFIEQLESRGFINARIVASPADIVAEKDGKEWFFEIKMTKTAAKNKAYFGAATITEWKQALTTPDRFFFVVAYTDDAEENFDFVEYSPAEFMGFSTIPPFKVFFNIPASNKQNNSKPANRRTALPANEENLKLLNQIYDELKTKSTTKNQS